MEYMKQQTLKKRRTRTKVKRPLKKQTKNNMKRRNSCKKRVTKGGMKGGWGLQLPVPSMLAQKKAATNEVPKMYGGWLDATQV